MAPNTYEKSGSDLILSTLDKGLHVLEVLAGIDTDDGLTLTELGLLLGMHRTTLLRILTTLRARDFVTRDHATDRYRVGLRVLTLSGAVLRHLDIRQIARPVLQEFCARIEELVLLTVLSEDAIVTIDRFEGHPTLSLRTVPGERRPLYCTAAGKALLANMPDAVVRDILAAGMPAMTPRTITSPETMRQQLVEIRQRGFAWDDEERIEELRCVAAPVFGHDGVAIAAISVVTFAMRTPWKQLLQLGDDTRHTAAEVSRRLGHTIGQPSQNKKA